MLTPDTLLHNRYRIQRMIGQGGMGAVYAAFDEALKNEIALKQTLVSIAADADQEARLARAFEREARLLAGLRHQSLPRVIDYFVDEEGQFLVMDYIPGQDLAAMLEERNGPFPVAQVIEWADQLLQALIYLHSQEPQVIHRDIKPQNLKLTGEGHIVLLDFGLAKGSETMKTHMTTTGGSIFGYTPQYAPLEQIQSTGTDPRSDLYSLAATLYHLMTNTAPVDALTRVATTMNDMPDPLVPPHELNPEIPRAVSGLLLYALSAKMSVRPGSATEMRHLLHEALQAPKVSTDQLKVIRNIASQAPLGRVDESAPSPLYTSSDSFSSSFATSAKSTTPTIHRGPHDVTTISGDPASHFNNNSAEGHAVPVATTYAPGQAQTVAPRENRWLLNALVGAIVVLLILIAVLVANGSLTTNNPSVTATNATPTATLIDTNATIVADLVFASTQEALGRRTATAERESEQATAQANQTATTQAEAVAAQKTAAAIATATMSDMRTATAQSRAAATQQSSKQQTATTIAATGTPSPTPTNAPTATLPPPTVAPPAPPQVAILPPPTPTTPPPPSPTTPPPPTPTPPPPPSPTTPPPPTPTPPPPPSPTTPPTRDGIWKGVTAQGKEITFNVQGNTITAFSWHADISDGCNSLGGQTVDTTETEVAQDMGIEGNNLTIAIDAGGYFKYEMGEHQHNVIIEGTFDSINDAYGSFEIGHRFVTIYCRSGSISWNATRQ